MEFEEILKEVGDFGRYQKFLLVIFLVPTSTFVPWITLNSVFVSSTPDHWCYVPEVESSCLSFEQKQLLIRPERDSYCSTYDVNFTKVLFFKNLTVNPNWPLKKCDQGWHFDDENYDETVVTKWNLVCDNDYYKSMVISFVFLGVIIGTPFYGFISDRCGRKPTFLGLALTLALAETGSTLCTNFTLFLILRIIIGSTMYLYTLGYIIALELVRPDLRARINGIAINCWAIGLCLLPLVAYLTRSWIKLTIVVASVSVFLLVYCWIIPESPSWLILQGRYGEASSVLKKISQSNYRTIPIEYILKQVQILGKQKEGQIIEKVSPMDFLIYPNLRLRFLLCAIVWIGCYVPYYGLQANLDNLIGNEFINFFLLSLVEIPAHIATWWLLSNIGRRKSVQLGLIVCILSCLCILFSPPRFLTLNMIATLVMKAGSSVVFMAQYQLCPELFPTSHRAIGMALTNTIGISSSLLSPFIATMGKYDPRLPYFVLSIICGLSCICASFLPETLNQLLPQSLRDIDEYQVKQNCFVPTLCTGEEYQLKRNKFMSFSRNITDYSVPKNIFTISYNKRMAND